MRTDRSPSQEFILCIFVINANEAVCHGMAYMFSSIAYVCTFYVLTKAQYCVT
jgi:hypothetical protein